MYYSSDENLHSSGEGSDHLSTDWSGEANLKSEGIPGAVRLFSDQKSRVQGGPTDGSRVAVGIAFPLELLWVSPFL